VTKTEEKKTRIVLTLPKKIKHELKYCLRYKIKQSEILPYLYDGINNKE